MALDPKGISGERCLETIRYLESIGVRVAGTQQERQAAAWICREFDRRGLTNIQEQEFPCLTFGHSRCELSVFANGRWKTVEALPAAHSPATSADGLETELVYIEKLPGSKRECAARLKGKAVLLFCSLLFDWSRFRRIMGSQPAALLVVDDRIPFSWTVAVGFPRYWIDLIDCPVVNISYTDAWELVRTGASGVRLSLQAFIRESISQNVIGDIPGCRWPEEIIIVSAHHDSVANNPGVDDNCTGVAAVLELARLFAGAAPGRTLRFISYGAEEQLSEGARHYAATTPDIKRIQFVLNTDSIGAWMGHTGIYCAGPAELPRLIEELNRATGFPGHVSLELSPFSDHFPLNLCGIPAVWYYRQTFAAARHYHHSAQETLEVVSPRVLESTIRHQAALLDRFANDETLPCPRRLTQRQQKQLRRMAGEWMGVRNGLTDRE
ncbi:MAG TPA: M28 family metallopeptidase [Acidobacteriota bacterium]|nr:M28 family metallopeptidase [Acidobacteriota bacterium]